MLVEASLLHSYYQHQPLNFTSGSRSRDASGIPNKEDGRLPGNRTHPGIPRRLDCSIRLKAAGWDS
jgi:hypothetical protein